MSHRDFGISIDTRLEKYMVRVPCMWGRDERASFFVLKNEHALTCTTVEDGKATSAK